MKDVNLVSDLHGQKVNKEEVARYYIDSEMRRLLPVGQNFSAQTLEAQQLWRFFEALSHTFRLNYMFEYVSNSGFDWYKFDIPVDLVMLPGMTKTMNKLIHSEQIHSDPFKLRDYLRAYYDDHPDDDPEELDECRPREIDSELGRIVLRKNGNKAKIIDGAHRFITMLLMDHATVPAYYCQPNGQPKKQMVGDATFQLLKRFYETTENERDRAAILEVVRVLLERSSDGERAIQEGWISIGQDDEVREAGKKLLDNYSL